MKAKYTFALILALLLFTTCSGPNFDEINIIPQPAHQNMMPGHFEIDQETRIITQISRKDVFEVCNYFNDILEKSAGYRLEIVSDQEVKSFSGDIVITTHNADTARGPESYTLDVTTNSIVLQAQDVAGLFYGVQTILQLLPPEIMSKSLVEDLNLEIQTLLITDYPGFSWRGMHLDVGRHMFPVEFIKKYLDIMAMYKMNVFHWHLTEDQGWRIEIMKYPKLTEVAAWRIEPDGSRYGGFYTQDDIREIVAYAAERQITIVPEIEMPGHCVAALAAYPEMSCTGGPFETATIWGVKKDVYCAGNEQTFEFLENVLLEVMDLFPGEYIHIGGDEVPKDRWEECPKCQARMRNEGLVDEHELQSYFIKRMEAFLNAHGRKMIGWDEILEGGLAPEATVMSWRGEKGGIEAAEMGHEVVMTPNSHCYFDHYQADPATQPKAIGGFTSLYDVYHYKPVPAELNDVEKDLVLGAQANVWTEYISTPEQVEYMAIPRMIALAEVDWSPERRINWERFLRKIKAQFKRLDVLDVNYCDAIFGLVIEPEFDQKKGVMMISMKSDLMDPIIYYTLDGSDPDLNSKLYDTTFQIDNSATIKACIFEDDEKLGPISSREIMLHKGAGKAISYKAPYAERYTAGGDQGLVNGIQGSVHYNDGNWQGFSGDDVDVVIDLGKPTSINSMSVSFMQNITTWIFLPSNIQFLASDIDNPDSFKLIGEFLTAVPMENKEAMVKKYSKNFSDVKARYIKLIAKNPGPCPQWHPGAGGPSWVFVDEIIIE